jgi:hypothetical protein
MNLWRWLAAVPLLAAATAARAQPAPEPTS